MISETLSEFEVCQIWSKKDIVMRGWFYLQRQLEHAKLPKTFFANIFKRGPILDAGCGTGQMVFDFTQLGYDAYGFDCAFFDQDLLNLMLKWSKLAPDRLIAAQSDALMFSDAQFQTITSFYGPLSYVKTVKSMEKTLAEFMRILKRNGKLIIAIVELNQPKGDFFWPVNQVNALYDTAEDIPLTEMEIQSIRQTFQHWLTSSISEGKIKARAYHTRWDFSGPPEDYHCSIGFGVITKLK